MFNMKEMDIALLMLGLIGVILYVLGKVNNQIALILIAFGVFLFYMRGQEKTQIPIRIAGDKAIAEMKRLQKRGEVDQGEIRLIPEGELKNIKYAGEINPTEYPILTLIDSKPISKKYWVKVSIYGDIIGWTEARTEDVLKFSEQYKEIGAEPSHIEKLKKAGQENEQRENIP